MTNSWHELAAQPSSINQSVKGCSYLTFLCRRVDRFIQSGNRPSILDEVSDSPQIGCKAQDEDRMISKQLNAHPIASSFSGASPVARHLQKSLLAAFQRQYSLLRVTNGMGVSREVSCIYYTGLEELCTTHQSPHMHLEFLERGSDENRI